MLSKPQENSAKFYGETIVLFGGTTTVRLGGTIILVLGGTTTLTSLGCFAPPPLVELHAARASMMKTRTTGIIFLGVIEYLSCLLSLKQFVRDEI